MNAGSSAERKTKESEGELKNLWNAVATFTQRKIQKEKPAKSFLIDPQMWLERWLMSCRSGSPFISIYPTTKLIGSSYMYVLEIKISRVFPSSSRRKCVKLRCCTNLSLVILPSFFLTCGMQITSATSFLTTHTHTLQNRLDCRTHL